MSSVSLSEKASKPQSSFNLTISETQMIAKSAVELPHHRVISQSLSMENGERQRILADDHDEEDPDDDLDF